MKVYSPKYESGAGRGILDNPIPFKDREGRSITTPIPLSPSYKFSIQPFRKVTAMFKTGDKVAFDDQEYPGQFTIAESQPLKYPNYYELEERPGELFKADRLYLVEFPKPINAITGEDVTDFVRYLNKVGDSFQAYQVVATKSAVYPGKGTPIGLMYLAMKLAGEAGEFNEHVGKACRDDALISVGPVWPLPQMPLTSLSQQQPYTPSRMTVDFGKLTEDRKESIILEISDILWYLAAICNELQIMLSNPALANLQKLHRRTEAGTLQGSGDKR